ncbi:ribonuclease E activity regulator RraA [bacterium]|nr:ribonuclease E activity regulator RraA [bacterium]
MPHRTADLYDRLADQLQVAEPLFRDFGKHRQFEGKIATLKVFEDNSLVRTRLEIDSPGTVLVVDGGGSLRCALLGDQLAQLAVDRHFSGILIFGCIRDSTILAGLPIGIKALATIPVKSIKRGEGQADVPVRFAGIEFRPGDYFYADDDGIVTTKTPVA